MGTNILPENLKGRTIWRTLGLHCQWALSPFLWLCRTKPLFYGGEGGTYIKRHHQLGREGKGQAVTGVP